MTDVITIGAATRDIFVRSSALSVHESPVSPSNLETCFPIGAKIDVDELIFDTGGGATNAAITFARLGFKASTICSIGDDPNGRDILSTLKTDKISTTFVQKNPTEQTGLSIIILAGSGERTILVHRGAAQHISTEKIPWNKLKTKWFYVTSLGGELNLLEKIFAQAEAIGAKIAWNPGNAELKLGLTTLSPFIRRADVFNLNLEEGAELIGAATFDLKSVIAKLQNLPHRVLIITDGANGAYAAETNGSTWHCESLKVNVVNTTGAGDAFGSGFVAGLLKKDDVRYSLAVGMRNAAGCIQITGAKHGLLDTFPSEAEIGQVKIEEWK